MKKYFSIFFIFFCYAQMTAQIEKKVTQEKQDSVYCLTVQDGLAKLTSSSGRVVTSDVHLPDGSRVTPGGIFTKKDGKQIIMKDGDCTNTIGAPMKGK